MKKILALFLALSLCLPFVGCRETPETPATQAPAQFSVGFAKTDITPTVSLPLDGYSGANAAQYRWSNFTETPLYATCTALTDQLEQTILLITLDLLDAAVSDTLSAAIAEATGVPKEQILIHATHTHSSVSLDVPDPAVMDYLTRLLDKTTAAAEAALRDRLPVTGLDTGFTRTEYCNSVRHYLLTDGQYIAYTAAKLPPDATWYGYTSASDDLLQVVRFVRQGGKPLVLVNWQAHPCAAVDKKTITADYPGILRNTLEETMDCHAVYIQGGAGNLMTGTELPAEKLKHDRNYHQLGQLLAEKAREALAESLPTDLTRLFIGSTQPELTTKDGNLRQVTCTAFSVGDFCLVTAPFEIFDTNAMAVKEASPYRMTFYASCCGGANGYLPTPESYNWTQAYEARITRFPAGTAEQVEEAQTRLLQELFASTGRTVSQKPAGYLRAEPTPVSDGRIYYAFTESLADFRPVENGFYRFDATDDKGNRVQLLLKDPEVAEAILQNPAAQYCFDAQNVVTAILPAS